MTSNYLCKLIGSINQACKKKSTYSVVENTYKNLLIVKLLYRNGLLTHYYFKNYINKKNQLCKTIVLFFKMGTANNTIHLLNQISKPGRRIYISKSELYHTFGKYNFSVVSTSMGFLTVNEARQLGIGGELLMGIDC